MCDSDLCPDQETLVKWNEGTLANSLFESVCDHIEGCADCQRRIEVIEDRFQGGVESLAGITLADLDRARLQIEADSPAVKAVSSWLEGMQSNRSDSFVPTLQVPCELRQYDVESLIGYGGMGEVYKARHRSLKRPVALKVMRSIRQDDPVAQAHFLREIETAGKFDHPNLVRAYDAWEQDGFIFLAQELLDGIPLPTIVAEGGIQKSSEAVAYMIAICRGVEELHARGFLHRDIKPSNIMRLHDGTIKLIDYGLAIPVDSDIANTTPRAGTVGYMAPEQMSGDGSIDPRSDIYSVGCVLKYLLRHLPVVSPDEGDASLRKELAKLASEMTQTIAEERPPTIAMVRQRLEKLQGTTLATQASNDKRSRYALGLWLIGLLLLAAPTSYLYTKKYDSVDTSRKPASEERQNEQPPTGFELKMIDIPAGQFVMGGVEEDNLIRSNELPRRMIVFPRPFRISAYEITVAQFREFVRATGYKTEGERSGGGGWLPSASSSYGTRSSEFNWSQSGYLMSENLPVTMVTYNDALAFCEWLSKRDQRFYRLPTEAEWEYCCRAGTSGLHPFPSNQINEFVWSQNNVGDYVAPRPVGTRQPNPWGIYDMIGNVREWCLDWYSDTAYQVDHETYPAGPETGDLRVIRGSCFMDRDSFSRPSHRGYLNPTTVVGNQGFRVVEVLSPASKQSD